MTIKNITDTEGIKLPLVEEFFSVQGEGFHTGKAAWFIRIGGCDVGCSWCDSKFSWNPDLHPLVSTDTIIKNALSSGANAVVITGGEPLMWDLNLLCAGLKSNNIETYLETSGTHPLTGEWDWICLSPKIGTSLVDEICNKADELKVIIEKPSDLNWASSCKLMVGDSCKLFLQPEWSRFDTIIPIIVEYVKSNPEWRISLQVHKYMHIP